MSNIKKTLLEGVEIKKSPAIVEFIDWYETNSFLTEEELGEVNDMLIEEDTIKEFVDYVSQSELYASAVGEQPGEWESFSTVLATCMSDHEANSFVVVQQIADENEISLGSIEDIKASIESMEGDDATEFYAALQDLSNSDTIEAIEHIASVFCSTELGELMSEMIKVQSKVAEYLKSSTDPTYEDEYNESYDNMGFADDDTLNAVLQVADIVAKDSSIKWSTLQQEVIQTDEIYAGLFENGKARFTMENVANVISEFKAVEDSIEESIERGLAKLQEHSKQLSRTTKKKSM